MPDIDGKELCINSDEALDLEMLPKSIVINGGGYIALEFAGIFSSFGSKVTLVYRGKNILRGFDSDISKFITEELKSSGKPDEIIKKISLGKINKFKEENSLLTQAWVMEPKKKVKDVIKELNIDDLKIIDFFRLKIGE